MILSEFKNEFNIHYNAIASQSAPGFDDYEISVFLTKAQEEIVKNYYNPKGNKYKEGFEDSEKRRVDLKELVKTYSSNTQIISFDGLSDNSKFFVIPDDVFLIIYETVTLDSSCVTKQPNVVPKTHDEFNVQYDNPFKNPDVSTIWRLNICKINDTNVVELISINNIVDYKIRYIKYPKPIILSDLNTLFPGENLTINGLSAPTECELQQGIHKEILDRAVELALRDYKPSNLESKIQLDQRNE
jgi:hypothetical protein